MNQHIKAYRAGFPPGLTWIIGADDAAGMGIGVGVQRFASGDMLDQAVTCETAWLLMNGQVDVEVYRDGNAPPVRASLMRHSLFDEAPSGFHVAYGCRVCLRARTDSELTVYQVRNERSFVPSIFHDVVDEHRGKGFAEDACYRLVRTILDRNNTPPESQLVLGEVVTQPGRWAGFPPHQHPQPEIYHYRFSRPQGFGYSEVGSEIFRVEQNDTVLIPGGLLHPQVAAPGYAMYFSWVIRHLPQRPYLKPTLDIGHTWIARGDGASQRPVALKAASPTPAKSIDVICLGRVAVDLYGEQVGAELEDVATFARYLGGCAGNVAVGCARLGLRSAMLSRVGDEQMGRFVRQTLVAEGVDVSHLTTDPQRLTGLVLLSIRHADSFPLLFYRENCADMALDEEDIDPEFIASARALHITGTHLSAQSVARATRRAIDMARVSGTRVVFDIDYRPVLWGLTGRGEGEQRYVQAPAVSEHLRNIVAECDLVVGTEEEFHIAAGCEDTLDALRDLRAISKAVFVVKRGQGGCVIYSGDIPAHVDDGLVVLPAQVHVLNVLGAGDAFLSGFLSGWLRDEPLARCGLLGNLAGALVVSRHGCAPAMPTRAELDTCLGRPEPLAWPDSDRRVARLHQLTQRQGMWPELMVMAFDHRSQFETMVAQAGVGRERIPALKALIASAAVDVARELPGRTGVLVDGRYGNGALGALVGKGLWIGQPVEEPGSRPIAFEAGMNVGLDLRRWPRGHVVKCLMRFHPDEATETRTQQEIRIAGLDAACRATGHEFMLEVILPEGSSLDRHTLPRALAHLYDQGVYPDWWKLPPQDAEVWEAVEGLISERDPACRGILFAGVDSSLEDLGRAFVAAAKRPLVRGFAVGRTIWGAPARAWLQGSLDDQETMATIADNYRRVIALWRQCRPQAPDA